MESFSDLVRRNRSYRRFYEDVAIDRETLYDLVDLARHSASGNNLQPLKFFLTWHPERNARIFPHLTWAGYLTDWPGPGEGERPAAYIVVLGDTRIRRTFTYDCGIAVQSILLGATERGLGGCLIGSVARAELRRELDLPSHLEILLVIALGKPRETVRLETVGPDGNVRYWRDEDGVHHVPKRPLDELIID